LRDARATRAYLEKHRPDVIIHAAAVVGGIGANRLQPGRFFYDNAIMGIQLIEEARRAGVAKFVCVGTTCSYPKFATVPFHEDQLWDGYPEETNAPYGLAKRMLLVQLQAYRQQYGMNGIYVIPANLYGPHDHVDLQTSHVIPAMIRKFVEARVSGSTVALWGDGSPTRDFLYVEDAAEGIAAAAEHYDGAEPVNLGTGKMITIRELASLIAKEVGYEGVVQWDGTMPNGQLERALDTARAHDRFGFDARTSLAEGIRRTVRWYENQRDKDDH